MFYNPTIICELMILGCNDSKVCILIPRKTLKNLQNNRGGNGMLFKSLTKNKAKIERRIQSTGKTEKKSVFVSQIKIPGKQTTNLLTYMQKLKMLISQEHRID
jgi:hypothetical protein